MVSTNERDNLSAVSFEECRSFIELRELNSRFSAILQNWRVENGAALLLVHINRATAFNGQLRLTLIQAYAGRLDNAGKSRSGETNHWFTRPVCLRNL